MTTLKSEFVDLANELIDDEFADFQSSTVINQYGTFDYDTQTAAVTATSTTGTIRLEFETRQFDGQKVLVGDYMLIGERAELSFVPRPDNCKCTRDGATLDIIRVEIDPADATFMLHVRPL